MLLLGLSVGQERFALPVEWVKEIIPLVELTPIPMTPEYVVGLLNFRGIPVPVLDLGAMIGQEFCQERLHTRIIILESRGEQERYLGLIGEKVTETTHQKEEEFIDVGMSVPGCDFLGGIRSEKGDTNRMIDLAKLWRQVEPLLFQDRSLEMS